MSDHQLARNAQGTKATQKQMPQLLEDVEDPSFATDFEPLELRRRQCENCNNALADWACTKCSRLYCRTCELDVHHEMESSGHGRDAREETKSDGRPHQEYLSVVNVCEECGRKGADFLCISCQMYQCDGCCAAKHLHTPTNGNHMCFCVEGSSSKLMCFAQWAPEFLEMTQAIHRQQYDDFDGMNSLQSDMVKMEQQPADSTSSFAENTLSELRELSIDGSSQAQPPTGQQSQNAGGAPEPTPQMSTQAVGSLQDVVDLTLSDDDEDYSQAATNASGPSIPLVKTEPQIKGEAAWLNAATAPVASESDVDMEELLSQVLQNDDPILRTMTGEYNRLSVVIYNTENEISKLRQRAKSARSMDEINQHKQSVNGLLARLSTENQNRNAVVAKIVVCIKSEPPELKALLDECTMDIPQAQSASHRKCAILEASIRAKLEVIDRLKRNMYEAMSMKKQMFEEIVRLGKMISEEEQTVRTLEQDRVEEFLRLCSFSQHIQAAVRGMASLPG